MSGRKGRSRTNKSNAQSNGQNKAQANQGNKGNQPSKSRNRKSTKRDPALFWGKSELLPTPESFITSTPEVMAVVSSLGRPPLPGHANASQHYFRLVYDRASSLAIALGHAGGLDDLRPLEELTPGARVEEDLEGPVDETFEDTRPT